MPSVSKKQHNFMAAVAKNPKFAKKAGVPQSVGEDYLKADKGQKFKRGGEMASIRKGATPEQKAKALAADKARQDKMRARGEENKKKKADADAKRKAEMDAKRKAHEDKKAAKSKAKAEKDAAKSKGKDMMNAPVKQPVVRKPGGILGPKKPGSTKYPDISKEQSQRGQQPRNRLKEYDAKMEKIYGKKQVQDRENKPVKQPVQKLPVIGKKPEKGGNKYKDFINKEKNLSAGTPPTPPTGMKKGGMACGKTKKYAKGGSVSSRADGVAKKGRTKCKYV